MRRKSEMPVDTGLLHALDANHSHLQEWEWFVVCFKRTSNFPPALPLVLVGIVAAVTAWAEPVRAEKRFFTVLAIEPKGGTTTDKEPFPTTTLPPGGGYLIAPPNERTGRWEVSAYVWHPSQIIVNEGDEVTLEFIGINGASHPTTIAAFGQTFTVKRGYAHRVTFKVDKVGIFGIACSTHEPSMSGELIVMPKR